MDLGYRMITVGARIVFAAWGLKFRFTGLRAIPDSGGALLAINHTSHVDFLMAGAAVHRANRRLVRFMAKKSIWQHPVAGRIMRMCRHIPVDRAAGAGAVPMVADALRRGELVGIYPEGTMSRAFEIKPLKTGAVRMAQASGRPLIPTIVWGAQRLITKDHPRNLRRRGIPIHVAFGDPLHVGPDDDVVATSEHLRTVLQTMLDEVIAAYPPMTGADLVFHPARLGGHAPTLAQAHDADLADATRTVDGWNR